MGVLTKRNSYPKEILPQSTGSAQTNGHRVSEEGLSEQNRGGMKEKETSHHSHKP